MSGIFIAERASDKFQLWLTIKILTSTRSETYMYVCVNKVQNNGKKKIHQGKICI